MTNTTALPSRALRPSRSRSLPLLLSLSLSLSLLVACSDDTPEPAPDLALDAGVDFAVDLITDLEADGSADAGADAAPDGGGTKVVSCANPAMTPPPLGTCSATKGTSGGLLIRGQILTPDKILDNGHLLLAGGKIVCVGCDCSAHSAYAGAAVVACAKGVVSPGLINPHDHLGWTLNPPKTTAFRYNHRHEWRKGLGGKPKISSPSSYKGDSLRYGELRMIIGGATSIMGSSGIGMLLRNLDKDNEGLGKASVDAPTFPLGDTSGKLLTQQCSYSKLPDPVKVKASTAYVPHVAEGVIEAARNEFLCLSGLQTGGVDVTLPQSAFIHAVGITAGDAAIMAHDGTSLIWSPRSNISLYGFTADAVMHDHLGNNIALGTDWTPSGSMNMLRELACADYFNKVHYGGHFSDEQLWRMATANAARAAGLGDLIGQLKVGTFADVAVFDGSVRTHHAAVIRAGVADVALVLRGGEALYGDDTAVAAIAPKGGSGCEPLKVCHTPKRVCLVREVGLTLAQLLASVGSSAYPLFYCKVPVDEPTCVPSRPGEFTGKPSAADADGDGVADAQDNCPKVFNPPRPMDAAQQPDVDKDKVGDACDVCPLDANTTVCSKPDPNDIDGDGVLNSKDNCPNHPNKGQQDADGDAIGDACDACPRPNPGGTACPFLIRELRDPALKVRPPDGTQVQVKRGVVTWVRTIKSSSQGYYLREGQGLHQAIFVYTGSATPADAGGKPLAVGQVISLEGELADYNKVDELEKPKNVKVIGSTWVTPLDVTTSQLLPGSASAEGLESHLVRVKKITIAGKVSPGSSDHFWITDQDSACSGTAPSCAQVGDYCYDGGAVDGKPSVQAGTVYSAITGVVNGYKDLHTLDVLGPKYLVP